MDEEDDREATMNTKDRSQILIPLSKAKSTSSLHSTTSSVATSLTSSETSFDPNADPESEPESDQRRRPRILGLRELSALSLQSGLHPPRPGSKDSQGPSAPHRTGHAGPAHGRAVGLEDTERAAKSIPRPGELKRTPSPPPRIRLMKAVTPVVMGDGGDGGGGRGGGGPFAREVEIKGWKIVGGRSWTDKAKVGAYVGELRRRISHLFSIPIPTVFVIIVASVCLRHHRRRQPHRSA